MYGGHTSGGARCGLVCMILFYSFGISLGICGLIWLIVGGQLFLTMGIIFTVMAAVLCAIGGCICCYLKKNREEASYPQGPIVSGSAPPGPVSGFHIQQGSQPGYHQAGSSPYPSAPYSSAPYQSGGGLQPSGANPPHYPNYNPGFGPAPPPSYDDVVK